MPATDYQSLKRRQLCVWCRRPRGAVRGILCASCSERHRIKQAAEYAAARAAGRCVDCGARAIASRCLSCKERRRTLPSRTNTRTVQRQRRRWRITAKQRAQGRLL